MTGRHCDRETVMGDTVSESHCGKISLWQGMAWIARMTRGVHKKRLI